MSGTLRMAALAAALIAAPLAAAYADRAPTGEEQLIIADILTSEGFASWGDVELDDDDGVWEIDDAVDQDGERRDLKLSANFEIINADEDLD
jgi:Peptidase propeptide and YPEB domain